MDINEQESWWVAWEYANYTDQEIDLQLSQAESYLDGHVKRLRYEKIKRLEANDNSFK